MNATVCYTRWWIRQRFIINVTQDYNSTCPISGVICVRLVLSLGTGGGVYPNIRYWTVFIVNSLKSAPRPRPHPPAMKLINIFRAILNAEMLLNLINLKVCMCSNISHNIMSFSYKNSYYNLYSFTLWICVLNTAFNSLKKTGFKTSNMYISTSWLICINKLGTNPLYKGTTYRIPTISI